MVRLSFVKDQAEQALTFVFAIALASVPAMLVFPKTSNPFNISNASELGFETNYLRVLGLAAFTLAAYWALRKLAARPRLFRVAIVFIASLVIFTTDFANLLNRQIDTFHYGEQLSVAVANAHGKQVYTDLFFVHGAGEDVFMPRLAFQLLSGGKPSIGAYLVFTELLRGLAVVALLTILALFLRKRLSFLLASVWTVGSIYGAIAYPKHILLYGGMTLLFVFLLHAHTNRYRMSLLGGLGLLASGSLFYSIDVGTVLTALSLAGCLALPFLAFDRPEQIGLTRPRHWQAALPSMVLFGGLLAGHLILLAGLGVHKYQAFLQLTFVDLPRFQTMLFSFSLPPFEPSAPYYGIWLPLVLIPVSIFLVISLVRSELSLQRRISSRLAFIILLLGTGLVMLRFAVTRPDFGHMADASPLFFIATFLAIEHYVGRTRQRTGHSLRHYAWAPSLFLLLLVWPSSTWDVSRMVSTQPVSYKDLSTLKHLPERTDYDWMNNEQRSVVDYIQRHSKPDDYLYAYTAEPLYYQLADRPNPSRFALAWFADPQPYTNELLSDLKQHRPKIIIYSGPSPYDTVDLVNIRDRVPEVDRWIKQNYPYEVKIGQTTLRTAEKL